MWQKPLWALGLLVLVGCGSDDNPSGNTGGTSGSGGSATGGSSGSGGSATGGSGATLSSEYPGDQGIENDPDVVWYEGFESATASAVVSRYDSSNSQGLSLSSDVAPNTSGTQSGRFTASGSGPNATDLYKRLDPGFDELFVRYYAKYEGGVSWHHTGVWVGGYNPASNWPSPQAGIKPDGDDRFHVSLEPISSGPNPRLDFYNYWMTMHSWMDNPSGNTAYYGNSLVHDANFRVDDDAWMCIEIKVKLNPSGSSGAGAELAVWKNDQSIIHYTDTAPLGRWLKDKFCPQNATANSCTDYPAPPGTQHIPLDLQYRSTTNLKLNAFWPQNYISSGGSGSVYYDHMVIATRRVGCQ